MTSRARSIKAEAIELTEQPFVPLPSPARLNDNEAAYFDSRPSSGNVTPSLAGGATSQAELNAVALPPVDGGRGAWTFLVCAFVVETFAWGFGFSFGIFQVYLVSHAPFNTSSIAAIGSIGTVALALEYMCPIGVMFVFKRYPDRARAILWGAVFVNSGSMLLSSWATSVWQLIILQGVLGGLSGAVLYTPVVLWMSVGGFVFPFLIQGLLDKMGYANTIRVWACLTIAAYGGSVYFMRPRLPLIRHTRGQTRGSFLPVDWKFLRNPTLWIMCATTFTFSLSFFPVSLYIPLYTVALASPLSATIALAVYNAASVIGQVGIGMLSDRYSYAPILAGISFACSLVTPMITIDRLFGLQAYLSWGFADSLAKVYVFVLLFGAFSGICSAWSAVARDISNGDSQLSSFIFCTFGISRGLASIVGPLIASGLYEEGKESIGAPYGSYGFRAVILFVGSMAMVSALLGGAMMGVKRMKTN